MKKTTYPLAIAVLASAGFAFSASAEVPEVGASVDGAAVGELSSALESMGSTYGGTIESLEVERRSDRTYYDVDLRDDSGSEWDLDIDAESGEVLKREQDD